ncbi:alpha/beta hydrolase [Devosia limi]|uniref:Arylformamidase n=1 Tax=Devosia limi DSM 17137 TaxID=1121477 RepID=A0A1M4TW06_9HYPH|nr:alpha/beta hydrolase [Devosia limi]SHE48632.1 arylformamidase [Devosia limi DSM 17137]
MSDGIDRVWLDEQFSLDRIEDIEQVFARRAEAARFGRANFDYVSAVPYGPHAAHRLNIFPARNTSGPSPVQLFIHGGFWRSLDADLFSFLASGFVPFGATLVVIDYPLMPRARMVDVVGAAGLAVEWVAGNIARYGGDPDRIFISGNSAGGHLVAELLDRAGTGIRGGAALSGIFDLEPVSRSFQNDSLMLTPEEIADFSPAARALDITAPLIVAAGGMETEIFRQQTTDFAHQCGVEPLIVPGLDHITIVLDGLADPAADLNRAVRRQMGLLAD